ncbi:Threonine/homoserine/homoserine lactone efflux protein [Lentzea xinjiangensis]|uniref:Threonine/homoserine/homoserine lactone efflux protein n=1 Tax=Lentzea xinjiangensis TaxID=402600 RepID=A0A1H9GIQ0_9PSEU|nr:LysE family translocator [Lentzea xinjiangensis]SEQ49965.1 Threonine/homoserine/homoserine lactone efflux protein [Lentzea xinjiangensis]
MHIAWTSFLAALLVIMVVPGPDFVLIMGNAVHSLRRGVQAALGVVTGLLVHATLATVGLSALVAAAPAALFAVKAIGALYLAWIGFTTLRTASKPAAGQRPRGNAFLRGLLCDLLNPKVMLTFLSLVPQAMDPHAAPLPQAALLSAVTVGVFAAFWVVVVPSARQLGGLLSRPGVRTTFERICGTALIGMAASVLAV